jgi:hypothetical protein
MWGSGYKNMPPPGPAPISRQSKLLKLKHNLLVNPHEALRFDVGRTSPKPASSADACHAAGEKWWGEADSDALLQLALQPPLLDGGEGESISLTTCVAPDDGGKINLAGLEPPQLVSTGAEVRGADTPQHRIENKRRRRAILALQKEKNPVDDLQGGI